MKEPAKAQGNGHGNRGRRSDTFVPPQGPSLPATTAGGGGTGGGGGERRERDWEMNDDRRRGGASGSLSKKAKQ